MKEIHKSVLLQEAIDSLSLKEDDVAVDMTLGFAGHSSEILKRIKKGYLFAFDQDSEVFTYSRNRLNAIGNNFELIHANFSEAKEELLERNITKVDAILYDLGVSSYQLDNKERGFSYNNDAVLDMRMNKDNPLTAKIVVNTYSEQELTRIFKLYGESKFARNIARNIVNKRKEKEINTTLELVSIIKEAVPIKERLKKHPAKQIFQAIRIEVNKELDVLVCTTLLERGITIPSVQVVVFKGNHSVFTTASLIQIFGRVGRSFKDPKGEGICLCQFSNQSIKDCVYQISKMNDTVYAATKK